MLKNARNAAAATLTMLMLAAGNAMAAVDPTVSQAISDGTADGKTIALGVLTLIVVVGVIRHTRRGV